MYTTIVVLLVMISLNLAIYRMRKQSKVMWNLRNAELRELRQEISEISR